MRYSITTTCFLMVGMVALGCRQTEVPNSTVPPTVQKPAVQGPAEDDLAMLRYDTGDVKRWPDFNFELQYSFDVPEVPPEVVGPFSAADIPAQE